MQKHDRLAPANNTQYRVGPAPSFLSYFFSSLLAHTAAVRKSNPVRHSAHPSPVRPCRAAATATCLGASNRHTLPTSALPTRSPATNLLPRLRRLGLRRLGTQPPVCLPACGLGGAQSHHHQRHVVRGAQLRAGEGEGRGGEGRGGEGVTFIIS